MITHCLLAPVTEKDLQVAFFATYILLLISCWSVSMSIPIHASASYGEHERWAIREQGVSIWWPLGDRSGFLLAVYSRCPRSCDVAQHIRGVGINQRA
jgi:hypothetical protein